MSHAPSPVTRWGVARGAAIIGAAIAAVLTLAACSQAGAASSAESPRATAYATAPEADSLDATGVAGSSGQIADPLSYTCELASDVVSELNNADVGFGRHGLTEDEWDARIDVAREKTDLLVAEGDPAVADEIEIIRAAVEDLGDEPGTYAAILALGKASSALGAKCAAHGTEILVTSEFED